MKKLFIALLSVMLLVSCIVFATNTEEYKMSLAVETPIEVTVGEKINVNVSFSESTGFSTLALKLTYPEGFVYIGDSAVASELVNTNFSLNSGATYIFEHSESSRTLTFVGGAAADITESAGSLFSAQFKVGNDALTGSTQYTFTIESADTAYNQNGNEVSVTSGNDTVTSVLPAAVIDTKVTYEEETGNYLADVYFKGDDANAVAFGYTYGTDLTFVSFTPADGLEIFVPSNNTLPVNDVSNRYYATAVTDTTDGVIEAESLENGVHLGTVTFTLTGEYSKEEASDNIAITAPRTAIDGVCTQQHFLFVPSTGTSFEVERLPVEFSAVDFGSTVKVIVNYTAKADAEAGGETVSNIGTLSVNGTQVASEEAGSTDNKLAYTINDADDELVIVAEKQGYVPCTYTFTPEAATDYTIEIDMIPGDVKNPALNTAEELSRDGYGVVDYVDFIRVLRGFDETATDDLKSAADINEDFDANGAIINVSDLNLVKNNYYGKSADYLNEEQHKITVTEGIIGDAE